MLSWTRKPATLCIQAAYQSMAALHCSFSLTGMHWGAQLCCLIETGLGFRYALTVWFSRKSKHDPARQRNTAAATAAQHAHSFSRADSAAERSLADHAYHAASASSPQQNARTKDSPVGSTAVQQQHGQCNSQKPSTAATAAAAPSKAKSPSRTTRAEAVTRAATVGTPAIGCNAVPSAQSVTAAAEQGPGRGAADERTQQQSGSDRLLSHAQASTSCNSGSSPTAALLDPYRGSIDPSTTPQASTHSMQDSNSATPFPQINSKQKQSSPEPSTAKQYDAKPEHTRQQSPLMPEPLAASMQATNCTSPSSRHTVKPGPGNIFVSIAAYRDPECQWTVCDLFKQAGEPELVNVGVVWQIDAVEDASFVRVAGSSKRHKQVTTCPACPVLLTLHFSFGKCTYCWDCMRTLALQAF